jgi:hypothetical protein
MLYRFSRRQERNQRVCSTESEEKYYYSTATPNAKI